MANAFRPKYFFAGLAITAAVSGAFALLTGLSFWLTWPITLIAMVLNGLLAEWEDNQPGGFNNP